MDRKAEEKRGTIEETLKSIVSLSEEVTLDRVAHDMATIRCKCEDIRKCLDNLANHEKVKRTERGWPGHFIGADRCNFRRNTLLEYKDVKVVVSTVGRWWVTVDGKIEMRPVGPNRYYETMAFYTDPTDTVYHDADTNRWIEMDCQWALNDKDSVKANDMHEQAVIWVTKQMLEGKI